MAYRTSDFARLASHTQIRDHARVPIVFELEATDPCLLCDAPLAEDDDGIESNVFEIVLEIEDAIA